MIEGLNRTGRAQLNEQQQADSVATWLGWASAEYGDDERNDGGNDDDAQYAHRRDSVRRDWAQSSARKERAARRRRRDQTRSANHPARQGLAVKKEPV